jgi:hypothetical protein
MRASECFPNMSSARLALAAPLSAAPVTMPRACDRPSRHGTNEHTATCEYVGREEFASGLLTDFKPVGRRGLLIIVDCRGARPRSSGHAHVDGESHVLAAGLLAEFLTLPPGSVRVRCTAWSVLPGEKQGRVGGEPRRGSGTSTSTPAAATAGCQTRVRDEGETGLPSRVENRS